MSPAADIPPKVEWLTVVGDIPTWRSIGLTVLDDGTVPLFGASLRVVPPTSDDSGGPSDPGATSSESGVVGWTLSGVPANVATRDTSFEIDGLSTVVVEPAPPIFVEHQLSASAIDHVVVLTPDLERTSDAIAEATGCQLKRIREVGAMRQGFHRIGRGGLIVELVERPDIADGDAVFWGLVLIVDELEKACAELGPDRISAPKDAVQPGRQIATIRGDVGLGLPLALMTG